MEVNPRAVWYALAVITVAALSVVEAVTGSIVVAVALAVIAIALALHIEGE